MFNVTRTPNPPESLAERRTWTGADVIDALRRIFHDKCYICETKEPLSLNVEHFEAHEGDDTKKFDWNNLFYACGRCNNIKRHLFNELIDCSDANIDALRLIRHAPPATPFSKEVTIQPTNHDPKTVETARLIAKTFNDDNTGNKEVTSTYLRKRVYKQYARLIQHINVYIDEDSLPRERDNALDHVKNLMNRTQEYSAFLRWAVLDSPQLLDLVRDAID